EGQITGCVDEGREPGARPAGIEGIAPVFGRVELASAAMAPGRRSNGPGHNAVREALEVLPVERPDALERARLREGRVQRYGRLPGDGGARAGRREIRVRDEDPGAGGVEDPGGSGRGVRHAVVPRLRVVTVAADPGFRPEFDGSACGQRRRECGRQLVRVDRANEEADVVLG